MLSNNWISQRKDNWSRLETLARQAETFGVRSLSHPELRDFGLLYRQAAADLSAARADRGSRAIEQYLNQVVSRAHNYVYSGQRISLLTVWRFLVHGYPRVIRRFKGYVYAAIAITLLTAALGAIITMVRPEFGVAFFGAERIADLDKHKMWTDSILSVKPEASSGIMTNNIMVCFLTFIGGITGGLFTLYSLFNNGLMLGVIAVICAQHHMALSLWSFISAHGALELPSIMFAGAAGLRLGAGILFPGNLRRRDSMAIAGSDAVQIVSGTIPLLIIAGILEAFLSPNHIAVGIKFGVGAVLFTGLCLWLYLGGRGTAEKRNSE